MVLHSYRISQVPKNVSCNTENALEKNRNESKMNEGLYLSIFAPLPSWISRRAICDGKVNSRFASGAVLEGFTVLGGEQEEVIYNLLK